MNSWTRRVAVAHQKNGTITASEKEVTGKFGGPIGVMRSTRLTAYGSAAAASSIMMWQRCARATVCTRAASATNA